MPILPAVFGQTMREALDLVKARDPMAATRIIREALSGAQPSPSPAPRPRPARSRLGLGATLESLLKKKPTPARRPGQDELGPGEFVAGDYVGAAGARAYKLYVPTHPAPEPESRVIVMLHGCTQSPDDFAAGAHMNAVCETRGWYALYPEQTKAANFNRCWNWFAPCDQSAQRGEPAILAAMTRRVMAERGLRHASVAGLSAGAAMAMILGDVAPELFDAVLAHSGLAAGAAHDLPTALAAMRAGPADMPARPYGPRVMIVQGMDDRTVAPRNADVIEGAIAGLGIPQTSAYREGERAVERREYHDRKGRLAVLSLRVAGLGHAWSGGSDAGSFSDPFGPDASAAFARFVTS